MPHIAEQQRGWEPEHTLSVAEAIKEAMDTTSPPRRSKSLRRGRPSGELPEPHLPLRKASAHGRMQSRKGSVPKPLFMPPPPRMSSVQQNHLHQLRGFNPSPVQPPMPHVDSFTASSEHAFAGREPRRQFKPALDVLEDQQQQTVLQYAEMRTPAFPDPDTTRPPSSPLHPPATSPLSSPRKKGKKLKSSRSVGEGLRSIKHKVSSKHHKDMNGRLTPDSFNTARPSPRAEDEIRESFRSALTSHSSLAHTSTNTTHTSLSSRSESFVKVRREDWDEGGLTDVDMSVEDAIGMYENGFESAAGSAKGSLDIRSIRSADVGRATPEVRSVRSLQLERPSSQPQPQQQPQVPKPMLSQPSTPTKKRPNAAHRRSQSASILILGVPRSARPGASPSPSLRAPMPPFAQEGQRTSMQIVCNEQSRPGTAAAVPSAVPRDRYGFKKASQHVTVEQYDQWNKHYSRHIERRSKKWHAMMRSYGLTTSPAIRFPPKSDKIKRYVRKGIPPEFRGAAWFWYAGGPGRLAKEPGLYWELVEKSKPDKGFLSSNDREHIERDLHRTFPDNIRFKPDPSTMMDAQAGAGGGDDSPDSKKKRRITKEPETPILKSLRRVLQAFAIHNPSIGYCQSLNFIAGLLLLFLDEDEEKAFTLLNVVTSIHLPGTHGVALEGANVDIAVLMSCIKDSLPLVWSKLDDKGGMMGGIGPAGGNLRLPTVSLATTAWFMSLFVGTLPIESVLRVWDCLFFEGSKTLFRIALAIFKAGEPQITRVSDPMEIFQVVQTIPRGMLDINGLMEVCFRRRGGFGGVSQGLVERRRAERRRIVKEGVEEAALDEGAFQKLRGKLRRQTGKV
ncbi:hypothetical protein M409DRAFT_22592 [Zasmidium cellare ATCC 36951]|uniref:Rab-GAP TBC domain-containing protein n=1 Tax=Zasmidium cellare ATCC 36951 TaxID=1080233 RepID=A0A6A6CIW2_ZASCE|nr:uncharacterized protein M409DRAFT_22592 [Zasmidium cellare ATCC 36951]KAF2167164.1 hypothetical protein M409DRAFT_22592 [Zasmidium cellare ATCC 36951]